MTHGKNAREHKAHAHRDTRDAATVTGKSLRVTGVQLQSALAALRTVPGHQAREAGGRGGRRGGATATESTRCPGGPGGPKRSSADGRLCVHLFDQARGELGVRGRRALLAAHVGPELVAGRAGDLDPDEAARRHRHRQLVGMLGLGLGLELGLGLGLGLGLALG